MPTDTTAASPVVKDAAERNRMQWTRKVWELLYGVWDDQLATRVEQAVGTVRRKAWKNLDLSANLYVQLWTAIAVLYDRWPGVSNTNGSEDDAAAMSKFVDDAMLWPLMARVERDTLGLREMLVRPVLTSAGLYYEPVPPHMVTAEPDPKMPSRPIQLSQAVERTVEGKRRWVWDVWDLRGEEPAYRYMSANMSEDISHLIEGGALVGDTYPWKFADGTPFIPHTFYHAAHTSKLFDAWATRELVEGTLELGVKYTHLSHLMHNCAWPQRWGLNVTASTDAVDESNDGNGQRQEVEADASTVLLLEVADANAGQAMVGQWAHGADPVAFQECITLYERRLTAFAGINPADQIRMAGDPRSGYAVAISHAAQRQAQARYSPLFAVSDAELLRKTAAMLNRAGLATLPESGWVVTHKGVPLSPEERAAQLERLVAGIAAGLISPVDAYIELHPGKTVEQAEAALQRIRAAKLVAGV